MNLNIIFLSVPVALILSSFSSFASNMDLSQSCDAGVLQVLNAEGAVITLEDDKYYLEDEYTTYNSAMKGPSVGTLQRAWISPPGIPPSPDGRSSIAFETKSCDPNDECIEHTNQKANFHFLYKQIQGGLEFDEEMFIGFNFMVSREQPEKDKGAILFQLWQGSPHSPPFAAKLESDGLGGSSLNFYVKNNFTGSNPSSDSVEIGSVANIKYDIWYQLVMAMTPTYPSRLLIYPSNTLRVLYKESTENAYSTINYHSYWGYDPENIVSCPYANNCEHLPNPKIDFKFGIYRPSATYPLQARFSNIKITDSQATADPQYVCN